MTTEDPLEIAITALMDASYQLDRVNKLFVELEDQQTDLIRHFEECNRQIRLIDAERNHWRQRGEELEMDRNLWQSKAEDALSELCVARRRAVELAYRLGEVHCPNCGGDQLAILRGMFPTGVEAPDGGKEQWYECAIDCQACGHREEVL